MTLNAFPQTNRWLRFVVLRHYGQEGVEDHYDLALDILGISGSRNPEELALEKMEIGEPGGRSITVNDSIMIRRKYLEYEGPMRGNRGFVRREDSGVYLLSDEGDLVFNGSLLNGRYQLRGEHPLILERVN